MTHLGFIHLQPPCTVPLDPTFLFALKIWSTFVDLECYSIFPSQQSIHHPRASMAKYSPRLFFVAFVVTTIFFVALWHPLTEGLKTRLASPSGKFQSPSDQQIQLQSTTTTTSPKSRENAAFPSKIWQTSKDPVASLDEKTWSIIKSWTDHNPSFRHEFLTSDISDTYVRENFPDDQEIQDTFLQLQAAILRADLIRYLVLYADGGIYNDLDVKCLRPVKDWLPSTLTKKASIVVGIEIDKKMNDGFHRLGFASWTIMTKPKQPVMAHVVKSVVNNLKTLAKTQKTNIAGVHVKYDDVIATTGPRAFSQAILGYLSQLTGTKVNYLNFTKITEPTLMEDVLVLPINSFGSGQAHSGSGSPSEESALAQHLWKGSWKKKPSDTVKSVINTSNDVSKETSAPIEKPRVTN